jgi:trimethylamine---corrinoid protein Co-methyltransferase
MRLQVEILTDSEKKSIQSGAFRVLEETGIRVHSKQLYRLLHEHGAKPSDRDSGDIKLPQQLIEKALHAVNKISTPAVNGSAVMPQFVMGSEMNIIDYRTLTSRAGGVKDCLEFITIGNNLEHIDQVSTGVIPSADVPVDIADVICYELLFKYSTKPIFSWIYSPRSACLILEMAALVAERDLHKGTIVYLAEPVSPLQFSEHTLEIMMLFADRNMPVRIAPMVLAGASGPVTLAGTVTLQLAEILAGLTLLYVLDTRSPVTVSAAAHIIDMSSGTCLFGPPEQTLLCIALMQVLHDYDLAVSANLGLTDANYPDFQAGFEKAFSTAMAVAAGAYKIGMQGIVGADNGFSAEQLVIDNEWAGWVKRIIQRNIEVTEETMAVEIINQTGIGGSHLEGKALDYTARHFQRTGKTGQLFNRRLYSQWLADGAKDTLIKASEKAEALKKIKAEPALDSATIKKIEAIKNKA